MAARATKFITVAISGNLTVGGTTITNGTVNDNLTMASGKTLAVTTADKLTVGGKIVPQTLLVQYRQAAGETPTTATIWRAPFACKLIGAYERHHVLGTNGGAVTMSAAKDPSGTAPGGGTGLLASTIDLKAANDTDQAASLSATPADLVFAAGDGLSVVFTGTMTAVAGVSGTFEFQRQ